MVPMASQTELSVSHDQPHPEQRQTSDRSSAPRSSSSTTGSSGLRELRMNCHQLPPPFSGRDSTIAVRKLYVSNPIATTRMTIADYRGR